MIDETGFEKVDMKQKLSAQEYKSAHENILPQEAVDTYVQELYQDRRILETLRVLTNRDLAMQLTPKDQIEKSYACMEHITRFLSKHSLPMQGMQQLKSAQYEFSKTLNSNLDE